MLSKEFIVLQTSSGDSRRNLYGKIFGDTSGPSLQKTMRVILPSAFRLTDLKANPESSAVSNDLDIVVTIQDIRLGLPCQHRLPSSVLHHWDAVV